MLIACHGQIDAELRDTRVTTAEETIAAVARLPLPLEKKAHLASMKTAGARYGLDVDEPSPAVATAFDQKMLALLCGRRQLRCTATSIALSWPGHRLFLEMATPFQTFSMAARQLARHQDIRTLFEETWQRRLAKEDWSGAGICSHMWRQCEKLRWTFDSLAF